MKSAIETFWKNEDDNRTDAFRCSMGIGREDTCFFFNDRDPAICTIIVKKYIFALEKINRFCCEDYKSREAALTIVRNIGEIARNFSWIYKREERNDTISSEIGLFALRKICKGDDSLL